MKHKLFDVKEDMKAKATEIITEFKKKGKEALNKVSEFFSAKKKLEKIRDKVRGVLSRQILLLSELMVLRKECMLPISRLQIASEF